MAQWGDTYQTVGLFLHVNQPVRERLIKTQIP